MESWYTSTISTVSGSVATWLTAVYTAAKEKKLTVGGTVKLVIMASDYKAPTPTLLEEIQTAIDPEQNAGRGLGLAPIGHVVHVTGVTPGGGGHCPPPHLCLRVGLGCRQELCGGRH